ncbi:hypothetical protein LEC33_27245 [Salmonella enterica]|nr:hypothetical protein [Salmonella enterica]
MMSNCIAVVVKFEKIEGTDAIKPIEWAIYDIVNKKILPECFDLPRYAEERIGELNSADEELEQDLKKVYPDTKYSQPKY